MVMKIIICLSIILAVALGQNWQVTQGYQGSCSSSPILYTASQATPCSTLSCSCGQGSCIQETCQTTTPAFPPGFVGVILYSDTNCQTPTNFAGYSSSYGCINTQTNSIITTCSGGGLTISTYSGFNCTGSPSTQTYQTGCVSTGLSSVSVTCTAKCFHEDTVINYKDEILTLQSLKEKQHQSCNVPHVANTSGLKISTSCNNNTLRLTQEHLVFTKRGLVSAGAIVVGDIVFQDHKETKMCSVTEIEPEFSTYFGLNCEESVVLANGYKTSTFGVNHEIPSLWMKYVSKLLGVRLASSFGDSIVSFLQKWNLF